MVYILYGKEKSRINIEVRNLVKKASVEYSNVNKFDLDKDKLTTIIDDANTISMFDDKRVVLVENANIFSGSKNLIDHDIEPLINYLKNINESTILIFTLDKEKLDDRKKLVKLAKDTCKVKEFNNIPINSYIDDLFKDYKISSSDKNLFLNRVGRNFEQLYNEAFKLKSYKTDTKEITKEDIEEVTVYNIEGDIFTFIDSIVLKDKNKALELYGKLLNEGEEPIKIISILGNQFRLMYSVKEMLLMGYSESLIASKLEVHPYRVKLAKQKAVKYDSDMLNSLIYKLADLDFKIKKGEIEKKLGLELFILEV